MLPEEIRKYGTDIEYITNSNPSIGQIDISGGLKNASIEAEKEAILNALISARYNKSKAAEFLNIDRKTLYNKIKQYNIEVDL